MVIINSLNTNNSASLLCYFVTLKTLTATALKCEFINIGTLTHTLLSYDKKLIALGIHLHSDYFILVIKVHTSYTHRCTASTSYISISEPDTHTILRYHEDISCIISSLNLDQLIIILDCDTDKTILSDILVIHLW